MTERDKLASYTTPNGNLITLFRLTSREAWATSCERLGETPSFIAVEERIRAREHYDLARRTGRVFGPFR